MQSSKLALVVGANGVIGHKLIEELVAQGWQVVGLSRRGAWTGHKCAIWRLICWMRR